MKKVLVIIIVLLVGVTILYVANQDNSSDQKSYHIYPELNDQLPQISSPLLMEDGREFVLAVTKENKYAVIPVGLSEDGGMCNQLLVDKEDFPALANTGLHDPNQLLEMKTITGMPVDEITQLGQPGGLSNGGFMAEGEDIISVIYNDDQLVRIMGLTHPMLAKPLFHILNMMEMDLSLNKWNMARHQWENIKYFYYQDQVVQIEAFDTKGGQQSIFDDGIEGSFHIRIWRELDEKETNFLKKHYNHLNNEEFEAFTKHLTHMNIGEMQPQYIMRYGFYEGHTFWRADPVTIAFIFGFANLHELHQVFAGQLDKKLMSHHVAGPS